MQNRKALEQEWQAEVLALFSAGQSEAQVREYLQAKGAYMPEIGRVTRAALRDFTRELVDETKVRILAGENHEEIERELTQRNLAKSPDQILSQAKADLISEAQTAVMTAVRQGIPAKQAAAECQNPVIGEQALLTWFLMDQVTSQASLEEEKKNNSAGAIALVVALIIIRIILRLMRDSS